MLSRPSLFPQQREAAWSWLPRSWWLRCLVLVVIVKIVVRVIDQPQPRPTSVSGDLPQRTVSIVEGDCWNWLWDTFQPRATDIYVATFGKSGTTWTQAIVQGILDHGAELTEPLAEAHPWIEECFDEVKAKASRKSIRMEAMQDPRHLKTHADIRAIKFHPEAHYIYVMRDPREVFLSAYDHMFGAVADRTASYDGPPTFRDSFYERLHGSEHTEQFLDKNLYWWLWARARPQNILLVHYANLKAQPREQIRRIAEFINVQLTEAELELVYQHSTFDYMRSHLGLMGGENEKHMVNKGTSGRWQGQLTSKQLARWDSILVEAWPPELKIFAETGVLPS